MWHGRTSIDSRRSPAGPAMATWFNGTNETLVLAYLDSNGIIYTAVGMEQTGQIQDNSASGGFTSTSSPGARVALVEAPPGSGWLWMAVNDLGAIALDVADSATAGPLSGYVLEHWPGPEGPDTAARLIGGPALMPQGLDLLVAATAAENQELYVGAGSLVGVADSLDVGVATYSGPNVSFVDTGYQNIGAGSPSEDINTPSLGITPAGHLQLAYLTAGRAGNHLTALQNPGNVFLQQSPVVFPDVCNDGPALVTTVDGYAAAYVNILNNIVLLYGVENNNPATINRVILQDTSPYTPAIATLSGVTYVAWIGTDDPARQTGDRLFFADLGSMPVWRCPVAEVIVKEGGSKAGEVSTQLHQLRDTSLAAEASGRWLIALLDQHSAELLRLFDAHPDLRRRTWDLLEQVAPIATANRPFTEAVIAAGEGLLQRVTRLASAPLQESARQVGRLLASLRGNTLADGLTAASRTRQDAAD